MKIRKLLDNDFAQLMMLVILFVMIQWIAVQLAEAESPTTIKVRSYYKPGYQSVSENWAFAIQRIGLRRTEDDFKVRFSHTFSKIKPTVAPYERDFDECFHIPDDISRGFRCEEMAYIGLHREQTDAWWRSEKFNEVSMFINPPVGDLHHNGDWLQGGLAIRTCYGPASIGIINATEVNSKGESRKRAAIENYRHELFHTIFNARHVEKCWNVMKTYSPFYSRVEIETQGKKGLQVMTDTFWHAEQCLGRNIKYKKRKCTQ